jgi:hypothetical protein
LSIRHPALRHFFGESKVLFRIAFFATATCFASLCQAAEPIAVMTVVDGDAVLVRQTTKLTLKAGMRLTALDMIETGQKTAIVRIEFVDGAVADLGPETRVMLAPKLVSGSKRRQATLYALEGWVKISRIQGKEPSATQLLSESMDISNVTGSAVISVHPKLNQVFAESGAVLVTERLQGHSLTTVALKPGAIFVRVGNEKGSMSAHPAPSFIQNVPRAFLDPIPLRASLFKNRPEPASQPNEELGYADALPWLGAEMAVRNLLVTRWRQHLNADLRTGLSSHIKVHPEWDRVLFPDKYQPNKAALTPPATN